MAGSQRLLVAVEVPAQLQNNLSSQQHAETIIVETATSIVRKRPRRSKPATKVVNYIESSDDEADMARASKRAKRVITDAEVRQVTNQMSRERLEGFIESLFKNSQDFRSNFKEEIKRFKEEQAPKPVSDVFPSSGNEKLGNLAILPTEILVDIFSYLPFNDRKRLTTLVSRGLNDYRWVSTLWREIDTREIPYSPLMDKIIPKISEHIPGCIRHLTLVYKQCQNPRAEKLLTYCAQNHTLQSLTLIQSSGNISAKRLAHVKKLLTKYDSFRQIRHFDIRMDNPPSYPKFDFTCVLELCKYWPKLHILKIKCPGYDMEDSLNVVNFKALGMRSQSGTFMGRPYNFITHLHFGSSTRIAPSVVCEIGRYFPELEVGIFKNVGETQRILERVKHAPSFYEVVNPMPRLRQLQIGIYGNPDAKGENKAVSALFFSCIHQAPVLRKFTFEHMAWSPSKKMELFCALKKSGGSWKGMRREELRELTIRGWALEWDVLTHRGYRFELPNVVSVEAPDCSNIRKDNLVQLMKNGGSYVNVATSSTSPSK